VALARDPSNGKDWRGLRWQKGLAWGIPCMHRTLFGTEIKAYDPAKTRVFLKECTAFALLKPG
jgi:hypothetical protein